mmetsp:Transcript_54273/g.115282  ORF Transcript_54273/g.115282 Transcript_54273/m.115282 type:complete len:359 (-) Transcript_54273:388-1464(-)|eukprot:CAMPEP_0172529850 /NCGR_PEP_ID=MMETSP1067-20121228/3808_1 /TAXON_ID=265564 ORGANISM="Thalassiosira punctigera, Strain Tpunct2005C2" /NCGR_SAMPLE_ID=MMETSP1067 /ASSEMBLY_ACC=CAM_ASM_000444 /LENGTH=358 /DNA_ID=CAMNT_0013313973 /DNA_START=59 /DNA_END=1135 /DNA_ORIENTATION=+
MDDYVKIASSLPPSGQLHTLTGIALVLGLGKGGVPGLATVATAATVLTAPSGVAGGLGFAVALMVPILTAIDVYAAWLHRLSLDWPTVWLLLPTSFIGMVIGQVADKYVTDQGARLLVGAILLGILSLRTWKDVAAYLFPAWSIRHHLSGDSREHKINVEGKGSMDEEEAECMLKKLNVENRDDMSDSSSHLDMDGGGGEGVVARKEKATTASSPSKPEAGIGRRKKKQQVGPATRFAWACAVGLVGGAATMLTNSMGPILNVYLLSVAKLSPESYVGTRAMFFCFLNLGKLPLRVMGGTLGMPMLPLASGLGAVAVLGVFLARPIMLGMEERTFVKLELGVVAFAGLRLCYMGLMKQ